MDEIKNIVQIVFWITMGILGVLSYRQAKRTVFSPIRTETFKLQLSALESVLKEFSGKSEVKIIDECDTKNVFSLNYFNLVNHFFKTFHPDCSLEKSLKEMKNNAVGMIAQASSLPREAKEGHYGIATTYDSEKIPKEPALKLSFWQSYSYELVFFTREYSNKIDSLEQLKCSPVLPSELRALISAYIEQLETNIGLIGAFLTEISQELPKHYTTVEEEYVNTGWAWNLYRDKWVELAPLSEEIEEWVNNYLRINLLTEKA